MNYSTLPKPFFVLAPMDDVTDTVFRQIIADCAPPDLFFTEFVNVDALQSKGREATLPRLQFTAKEKPLIAQVWGLSPENFYQSAKDIVSMGFDGVDINFGCPIKNVVQNGACAAFIQPANWGRAVEVIKATREGAGPHFPISVKTRTGFNEVDLSWHKLLLQQKLNMLTIHGRTKSQMSKVPADWQTIGQIRELRDQLSPTTLIVGNGDVMTKSQGEKLAKDYNLDGVMVGRGIFQDPFIFSKDGSWKEFGKRERLGLYKKHIGLFIETWKDKPRNIHTLNKFCKIYVNGFDGAKELRDRLMRITSADELLDLLENELV